MKKFALQAQKANGACISFSFIDMSLCLGMYICADAQSGQKRAVDPLESELKQLADAGN